MGKRFLIYGANGYTGALTAQRATRSGLRPVLAGRNEKALRELAGHLDLPFRIFDLADSRAARAALEDIDAVLHMAGPFSATSAPMIDACLATGTHYLDITGEISVFEALFKRHREAVDAGIVILPGVGFDVVPTDCIAAFLHEQLPDATTLELAFGGSAATSPGTMKTMVEGLGLGCAARIDGRITTLPSGSTTAVIPFADKPRHAVAIPWGDVATAYHSTGIPNITTYMAMPRRAVKILKGIDIAGPVLQLGPVQKALKKLVTWRVKGPGEQQRSRGLSQLWGKVENPRGASVSVTMTAPEGYTLTTRSALEAVGKVLNGEVEPGTVTPAKAFGWRFVTSLDDVILHEPGVMAM